jgi:hypothetical protein
VKSPIPPPKPYTLGYAGDDVFSVSFGFWMSPLAVPILRENEVDGIIMDTTFKVMRQYRTALLIAVIHTVSFWAFLSVPASQQGGALS